MTKRPRKPTLTEQHAAQLLHMPAPITVKAPTPAKTPAKAKAKAKTKVPSHLPPGEHSLEEAQRWLTTEMCQPGRLPHCPCCGRVAKVYNRTLNKNMVGVLLLLYHRHSAAEWLTGLCWVQLPPLLKRSKRRNDQGEWGGDYGKLRFWGLIVPQPGTRGDGSTRTGYWQLTPLGLQFAQALVKVPRRVFTYNNAPFEPLNRQRDPDDVISIREVRGFDYDAIIRHA